MGHYIILGKWTEQGIRNVKDAPKRVQAAKASIEKVGGKMHALYITMGKYDFVAVAEAPSDDAMMQFALATGMQGNVRTTTMRAWTSDDAAKVLAKL
ncbi:MAG TPA: GYD domain-containing protein [Thermoplasmata archaeon]|nr:GYD domain-containing protein [Thermoplasmata archaeon]